MRCRMCQGCAGWCRSAPRCLRVVPGTVRGWMPTGNRSAPGAACRRRSPPTFNPFRTMSSRPSACAATAARALDAAHSYALLVGVPSNEDTGLLRVKPGVPDSSYLILKLQGSPGIVGAQMPFGGPPLPQATLDVIRQWITNGAANGVMASERAASFAVAATSPEDQSRVAGPVLQIVVAFNHEVDASLINDTTLRLERLTAGAAAPSGSISARLAEGNASVLVIIPRSALGAGTYRLTLRGSGGGALADVDARALGNDYSWEFTVDSAP